MRYLALVHVTVVVILVLSFLFLLSGVLKTLLEDILPHALSKAELAVVAPHPVGNGTIEIPVIIHQVYLGFDGIEIPPEWRQASQSCIDLNANFEHLLWTNETSRDLLARQYPWFLETWDNYKYSIQRADSIRYFILEHHGGVYVDLDNGCRRSLEPLLSFPSWMPGTKIHVGLTNHVMGTRKGHPYFQLLISRLQAYDYDWLLPYMTIMNSAGPHFVSMVWEEYLETKPAPKDAIRILMQEEYLGTNWSFFTKVQGGTWNRWDTAAFKWVGDHIVLVSFTSLLCLCAATSCIWLLGWRLAASVRKRPMQGLLRPALPLWRKSD